MNKNYENFTIKLALVDAIPVIFFLLNTLCIQTIFKSYLFCLGAFICVLSGCCKVLWEILIALKKKNKMILSKQMRSLMPLGFFMILLSFYIDRKLIDFNMILSIVRVPYVCGFFIFGLIIMMILAKKMDQSHAKNNWIEQICNRLVQLSILIGVMQIAYFSQYYPSQDVESYLESDSSVQVQKIDEGWLFDSPEIKRR